MDAEEYYKIFKFINDASFSKGKHNCL